MLNNIDQENLSANDDNNDASIDRGENDYFLCTSCEVRTFFTYCGLNQHLQQSTKLLHISGIKTTPSNLFEENDRCNSH